MKILLTLAGLDIGGAETHVAELAAELHRRGHEIIVASSGGVYAKDLEALGIRHFTVPLAERKISHMLKARRMLKKIIRTEKPDIVHAHARIPAFIVNTLRRCCDFVFVTTVHGAFDTSFILRRLSGWGCKTLAVSSDLREYLMKNYHIDRQNIILSVNGINTEKFNPDIDGSDIEKEFNFSEGENRICYVSRLAEGICSCAYTLIERFEEINSRVDNLRLIIVGGGDLYNDLKAKADAVNERIGRDAIVLTGARTDVNKILACADVCVGVSRAVLEAMAMEKFCIAAGDPGYIGIINEDSFDDAVDCNFTCRGHKSVDGAELADDIVRLFNLNDEEAAELKEFVGDVIRFNYSVKIMTDGNERMYTAAMQENKCDAVILGYYGFENCGDDALLHAIIDDIRSIRPTFSATVLSSNPESTAADYKVQSISRLNPFKIYRSFKNARLFIAGGGSLIQDVTSTKSLFYYLSVIRLAKMRGVPVMLYGNGIGPINKPANRKAAARVLNKADVITLRDPDSAELLKEMNVTKPKILVTADPALNLNKDVSEFDLMTKMSLFSAGLKPGEKYFCLSVRTWKDMGNATDAFVRICNIGREKFGLTPVLIPMQFENDLPVSAEIAKRAGRCVIIPRPLAGSEILSILNGAEAVIAVRLHMLVFGTLTGTPVLGANYDPKVRSFCRYTGLDCIDTNDFADGSYVEKVYSFFDNREKIAEQMNARMPELKQKAFENAKIAAEMIEKNER